MYAELQRLVEQSQAELVELIASRQREAERHAQELARGLENELSVLRRSSSELEAFAHTQDRIVFLQVRPAAQGVSGSDRMGSIGCQGDVMCYTKAMAGGVRYVLLAAFPVVWSLCVVAL